MLATESGIVPGRVQAVTALSHATPGPPGSTAFHFDPVHGMLPSEYDICEVSEELYLAVLEARNHAQL